MYHRPLLLPLSRSNDWIHFGVTMFPVNCNYFIDVTSLKYDIGHRKTQCLICFGALVNFDAVVLQSG